MEKTIEFVVNIFYIVKEFFKDNSDWFGGFIETVVFGWGILTVLIKIINWQKRRKKLTEEVKRARNTIENASYNYKAQIISEPLFFDEPNEEEYLFYKKTPIIKEVKK